MVTTSRGFAPTIFAAFAEPVMRMRNKREGNALKRIPLSSWGMSIAHLGFGISALGVAVVSVYGYERDAAMNAIRSLSSGALTLERVNPKQIEAGLDANAKTDMPHFKFF